VDITRSGFLLYLLLYCLLQMGAEWEGLREKNRASVHLPAV